MANSGVPALRSALVATNTIPVAAAVKGCVVMVVVVVAVGTPTASGACSQHRKQVAVRSIRRETSETPKAPTMTCSFDDLASEMVCQTQTPEC